MGRQLTFDADRMYDLVVRQARMGARRPGSAAGRENENFLEDSLRDFGLEAVRREPIPITRWESRDACLEVNRDGVFEEVTSFPIPYTAFTPGGGIEAPLVYAAPGRIWHRGDWSGAVVVTEIGFPSLDVKLLTKIIPGLFDPDDTIGDFNHPATWVRLGWHLYRLAARRGAAGFIGIVRDQPGGGCRMYAPYGFREKDLLDKPLPGFWVGRSDGGWLGELARSGAGRARIRSTGTRELATTHNIVGEIPGGSNEEVLVLGCHHDSPFESPVEDGTGVAVVLALAEHFAAARDLRRRLVILLSAGHFYGSLGTRTFIREHREDIVRRAVMEISIEHVGHEAVEDGSGHLIESGKPEVAGVFVPFNREVVAAVMDSTRTHDLRRIVLLPAEGPMGDYPPTDGGDWYDAGVPVINYISNPVYLLTDDDALRWVDRNRLPVVAASFAEIVRRIDAIPKERLRAEDMRGYHLFMKLLKHVSRARVTGFGLKPVY